jgi:DNA-binding transcriptional regulator PaaX
MSAKAEEFLTLMLWTYDLFARPSFSRAGESYERWAYRNGFLKSVQRLENRGLVERKSGVSDSRVCRLTESARLQVIGGRDPSGRWSRAWDGRWRVALFDVPVGDEGRRKRLRRYLRSCGFGCLQNSVWVCPDPLRDPAALADRHSNVTSFILLEARPCAGETDAAIVNAAWDWAHINQLYRKYLHTLDERPTAEPRTEAAAKTLRAWAVQERSAFLAAVSKDPLLPQRLLPEGYLGQNAWRSRIRAQPAIANQLKCLAATSIDGGWCDRDHGRFHVPPGTSIRKRLPKSITV